MLEKLASDSTGGSTDTTTGGGIGNGQNSSTSPEFDMPSFSGNRSPGDSIDSTTNSTITGLPTSSDGSASDDAGSSGQIELGAPPGDSSDDSQEAEEKQDSIERQDREISAALANKNPKEVGVVKKDELGSGESAGTKTTTHTVQKGETLAGISRQYYGVAGRWRRIMKANALVLDNPRDLHPGMKLTIPVGSDNATSEAGPNLPEPTGPGLQEGPNGHTVYKVQKSDTLYSIAHEYYDNASLWRHILNANSDVLDSPEDLQVGMKLIMP